MSDVDVDYAPSVPEDLRSELEQAARTVGLPLADLELLGQDLLVAMRFVASVHADRHAAFLDDVAWDQLESMLQNRSSWSRRPVTVA